MEIQCRVLVVLVGGCQGPGSHCTRTSPCPNTYSLCPKTSARVGRRPSGCQPAAGPASLLHCGCRGVCPCAYIVGSTTDILTHRHTLLDTLRPSQRQAHIIIHVMVKTGTRTQIHNTRREIWTHTRCPFNNALCVPSTLTDIFIHTFSRQECVVHVPTSAAPLSHTHLTYTHLTQKSIYTLCTQTHIHTHPEYVR